jgi:syntaxin-binding protein 1
MVYDLMAVDNDVVEYEQEAQGKKTLKKVVLSDADDLFKRYKYKHIGEVLEGVPLEFRNFVNTNTTARVQQG